MKAEVVICLKESTVRLVGTEPVFGLMALYGGGRASITKGSILLPKHWQRNPFPCLVMATKQQHQQQIAIKAENQSSVCATHIHYNEFAVLILIILPL